MSDLGVPDLKSRARRGWRAMQVAVILAMAGLAHGRAYPSKPIRIVTGGNPLDLLPRLLQPKLAEHLGQAIVIESKALGPGGILIQSTSCRTRISYPFQPWAAA